MYFIGDVHGKINDYWKLLQKIDESIQVGDFGFKKHHEWFLDHIDSNKHKVLFGNHDYYPYLRMKHSLEDFTYNDSLDLMAIRGAYSIDKYQRIEGLDWFINEELNYTEMNDAIDLYEKKKPSIVVTHDCPRIVRENMFNIYDKTITSYGLQEMFEIHQPDIWIFGHHHKSKNEIIDGTKFICLNELEVLKL